MSAGSAALLFPLVFHAAGVEAPTLRAALETMMTLFALGGASMLRAQFASSRRLRDLLLFGGSLVLGLMNFWAAALPAALDLHAGAYFPAAALVGQLVVGGIFAAAAFAPAHRLVTNPAHPVAIAALLGLVTLVSVGLGGLLISALGVEATTHAVMTLASALAHPLLSVLALGATGLLAYGAIGFARRQRLEADGVAALLAIAAIMMAGASLSQMVTRSLSPGRIGPGEGLRVIAFALILAAAIRLERQVRAQAAKTVALAERRRVARDLHDGLAQDLAFIAAHGPRIAQEIGEEHPVVTAARRALAISRNTISELSDPAGATAQESLEAMAQELRDRFDIAIAVDAQLVGDLPSDARDNVTRIAREAIANAARHGRARNVIVSLRHAESGVALRVLDDGCGILGAARSAVPEGFGLRSMRERAAALGGFLSVRPARKGGTELEVILP